jgi:hypothetical protein
MKTLLAGLCRKLRARHLGFKTKQEGVFLAR